MAAAYLGLALVLASPLRIGFSGDYLPFAGRDARGRAIGLDAELAHRLGADLGRRVQLVDFEWEHLLRDLRGGRFDLVASGVTMRPERAIFGRFSRPYALTGAVALIRREDRPRLDSLRALDRAGVRVAVHAGGHLERVARRLFSRAAVTAVADNASLPGRLLDGRVDAVLTDSAEARQWMRAELYAVGPFTQDHKALLLPRSAQALAEQIDDWLVARERDGWLDARRVHWLGDRASIDFDAMTRQAVAALIELRLELMPAIAAAKLTMGKPLRDEEQERRVLRYLTARADQPQRVARLYRVIFDLARRVQAASAPHSAPAGLEALREAVRRIDEQIVRELDRVAPAAAADWLRELGDIALLPGLDALAAARLATALPRSDPGSRRSPSPVR